MNRIFLSTLLLSAGFLSLTLSSCKKETPDTETQASVDNAVCEGEFNSRIQVINSIAINQPGVKDNRTSGPIVTVDPADTLNGFPITMNIDYGTLGIEDSIDHKVRKGKMIVRFDASWHTLGAIAVVKLVDYYVAKSTGANFVMYSADSIILTHMTAGSFTQNVIGGKCISSDFNLEWSSDRTVTQTEGILTTSNPYDDVFSAAGSSKGKDRNGKSYSVNITSPIVKRASCSWIEKGTLDLTPEGLPVRTVNYGDGACDSKASITIDGNTFTFNMN